MRHTALFLFAAIVSAPLAAHAVPHDARISAWIVDPRGNVDGALLSDRASIRFSPANGASLAQHARIGERVVVSDDGQHLSVPRTGWSLEIGLGMLGARGGGPLPQPPLTVRERAADGMRIEGGRGEPGVQRFTVDGIVAGPTYAPGHRVDGFVLRGGITVRVPVARAGNITSLRPGSRVVVVGDGVRGRHGIGIRASTVRDARGTVLYSESAR